MTKKPDIIIIGTGAVGGYYGARLSQGGASVSAVCRSDFEAVRKNGIHINSVRGDFLFRPEQVMRSISEYSRAPEFILVATKSIPDINIPSLIRAGVGPETAIILLQNGIGIEAPVHEAFPENELISGLAFICVSRSDMGIIDHQDYGRIVIGRYPSGSGEKIELLAGLFRNAGVPCDVTEDILTARWRKLLWNAPLNPISVIAGGASTREMIESEDIVRLATRVMEEVMALARAEGHPLPTNAIRLNVEETRKMIPYKTSMLQDYEAGKPLEVEAILGNALRIARNHQIPVPYMESLYRLLSFINEKSAKRS